MKQVEIIICTDPTHYMAEAHLFKQLNLLLSAKMKSQVRVTGVQPKALIDEDTEPCRVWVDNTPVEPQTATILQAVRQALRPVRPIGVAA